jgi:hypothetical protein
MGLKKWILFSVGGRLPSPTSPEAEHLAAVMRHNLELLDEPAGLSRQRDLAAEVELDAVKTELTEAYATIAALLDDLELSRMRAEDLELRLAEYEDGTVAPTCR